MFTRRRVLAGLQVQVQVLVTADHGSKAGRDGQGDGLVLGERDGADRGQTVPMAPSGAVGTNWLQVTEIGSVWYADLSNSGSGVLPLAYL